MACTRNEFSLNTCSALAMAPTSSLRPSEGISDVQLAIGEPLHRTGHPGDRPDHALCHSGDPGADDEKDECGNAPEQNREPLNLAGGFGLGSRVVVGGLLDDLVDDGAVRGIGRGDLGV